MIDVIATTFDTIALELRAHKWDVQDKRQLPVLEDLAVLMDEAYEANQVDDRDRVVASVEAYRRLYAAHTEDLK